MSSLKDSCSHRLQQGWKVSPPCKCWPLKKGRNPSLLSPHFGAKQDIEFRVSSVLPREWLPKLLWCFLVFFFSSWKYCIAVYDLVDLRCQYICSVRNTLSLLNMTLWLLQLWKEVFLSLRCFSVINYFYLLWSVSGDGFITGRIFLRDGHGCCSLINAERCQSSWLSSQINERTQLLAVVFPSDKVLPK